MLVKENGKSHNESKSKKCGSIFMFSENSRKMMINDSKIGESSIIGENNVMIYHEKNKINNNKKILRLAKRTKLIYIIKEKL